MKNWLKEIKLITWDLDGTLYPSSHTLSVEIGKKKIKKVAQHLNCSLEEARVKFDDILSRTRSNTKALDELGIDGTKFFVDLWVEMGLSKHIQKNPELVSLFEKVDAIPHAMLTNSNSRESIELKLGLIGLKLSLFLFIITSVEVGFNKPSLEIFQILIEKAELSPHQILYVGDREKTDIVPAKELGIKTCMVGGESNVADVCVQNATELLEILDFLQNKEV